MAMKFLAFHDEFVAYLAANDEDDYFTLIHIIQDTEFSRPQFVLGE
jgi:hypothetical protein